MTDLTREAGRAALGAARAARDRADLARRLRPTGLRRWLVCEAAPWLRNRRAGRGLDESGVDGPGLARARVAALVVATERLPLSEAFLDHHRRMGVDRFLGLALGDAATPAARDVSWARLGDAAPAAVVRAVGGLAARWRPGAWTLFLLPNEFFVYPHADHRGLRDLVQHLEDDRRLAMHAATIDLYGPECSGDLARLAAGARWFDPFGYVQHAGLDGVTEVRGGPLARLGTPDAPHLAPTLQRIALVRWAAHHEFVRFRQRTRLLALNRAHKPGEVSITGALLRFGALGAEGAPVGRLSGAAGLQDEYGDLTAPPRPSGWFDPGFAAAYGGPADLVRLGLMSPGRWF
jgi:hypothetical protein